ncbi:hypothetical protein ACHHYP_03835 [Achlya hypogyna]|uniref:RING-type domain-containing protein n=1 Tax=Achlya hypogyna TaxID=1202772 RepID=A0A1V9Z364_ACHHY|nr:hypothetical protein ACHHYP_03835 [Achlya hypogyna]
MLFPDHTRYTLVIVCPKACEFWVLQKRYSEFLALHQALRRYSRGTLKTLVRPVLDLAFPQRHFRADDAVIRHERRRMFSDFVEQVVALLCRCTALTTAPAADLAAIIQGFLNASAGDHATGLPNASAAGCCKSSERCAICLDGLEASADPALPWHLQLPQRVLLLVCGHAFHEGCVVPWLGRNTTCPLCRRMSCRGLVQ